MGTDGRTNKSGQVPALCLVVNSFLGLLWLLASVAIVFYAERKKDSTCQGFT